MPSYRLYVMTYRRFKVGAHLGVHNVTQSYVVSTLHEMKPSEFNKLPQEEDHWSEEVSGRDAHKHVLAGGHHTTNLYVDSDGRIRKANDK